MTISPRLAAAASLLMLAAQGHVPALQAATPQAPSFTSATDLVVMNVVVRDREGRPVDGLPREAFTVYENGISRDIDLFAGRDEPITLGLVIDASGSMLANRARVAYAVGQFADTGRPDDEVFALVVGDRVTPVLPPDRPFTSSPEVLRAAVWRHAGLLGRTAIWDGVLEGLAYLDRGSHTRRALVVISDGQDNASRATFDEVLLRVRASGAAVYTMGMIDPIELERQPRTLRELGRASGGEAFFPGTHQAAIEALDTIARQIHSAYTIGFAPSALGRDGRYHRLGVKVRAADGRTLQARTRAGYQAATGN